MNDMEDTQDITTTSPSSTSRRSRVTESRAFESRTSTERSPIVFGSGEPF